MNRIDARKIAEDITREQLALMFKNAKSGITDWRKLSAVNPYRTKGSAWNIFYPAFMGGRRLARPAIINMVHEFGDFLPADLKPVKKPRSKKPQIEPLHEEPNFGVR